MNAIAFVSYSRSDLTIVRPIAQLLRTAISGVPSVSGSQWELVFLDLDSLEPGSDWKKGIDDAIAKAERLFVFWCSHSAKSNQVKREYKLGLKLCKILIPVLFDDTPLSTSLSSINCIDFRELRLHETPLDLYGTAKRERSPEEAIIHQFAQKLDMDGNWMLARWMAFWMDYQFNQRERDTGI